MTKWKILAVGLIWGAAPAPVYIWLILRALV